jgi:hypothetical protein
MTRRTHVAKAAGDEPGRQVGGRIVERRCPHVRPTTQRREQHEHLGQPPIEGTGLDRPAQPFETVPEQLRVGWIVEQDRVPEVAQRPARDGVHARLVEQQPMHRPGIDPAGRARVVRGPGRHRPTIARRPGRRRAVSVALDDEGRGARREIEQGWSRQPGRVEPGRNWSRVARPFPGTGSSSWTPR